MGLRLLVQTLDGLNGAVGVVVELCHLEGTEPRLVVGWHAVVVEEVPLALELGNGMVCGPAHHGGEDDALIGEGALWIVGRGVAEEVRVAGGV